MTNDSPITIPPDWTPEQLAAMREAARQKVEGFRRKIHIHAPNYTAKDKKK